MNSTANYNRQTRKVQLQLWPTKNLNSFQMGICDQLHNKVFDAQLILGDSYF